MSQSTTVNAWLQAATKQLESAGIGTARLDALVLLADILNKNSAQVLAEPNRQLTSEHIKKLARQLAKRANHAPLAYVRGITEFYGRDFIITPAVLEPRPETETMIDLCKQLPGKQPKTIIDVGTGSGAIAITIAHELGAVEVLATDVDEACIRVARRNVVKHGATVDLHKTDLLQGLRINGATVVLANLPYLPDGYRINKAAEHEPEIALFGGLDGLHLYRRLFAQIAKSKIPPLFVLTESLPPQHHSLAEIARQYGYALRQSDDFIQVFEPF